MEKVPGGPFNWLPRGWTVIVAGRQCEVNRGPVAGGTGDRGPGTEAFLYSKLTGRGNPSIKRGMRVFATKAPLCPDEPELGQDLS